MAPEETRQELTPEELDSQELAELPDREALTLLNPGITPIGPESVGVIPPPEPYPVE